MPTDKPTDLRARLRALPYSDGNVKRALVIDLLPPGDEPVYAVTASAAALVTDLLGEVGFMRSCIASGEKLNADDLDRQNGAMARAVTFLRELRP